MLAYDHRGSRRSSASAANGSIAAKGPKMNGPAPRAITRCGRGRRDKSLVAGGLLRRSVLAARARLRLVPDAEVQGGLQVPHARVVRVDLRDALQALEGPPVLPDPREEDAPRKERVGIVRVPFQGVLALLEALRDELQDLPASRRRRLGGRVPRIVVRAGPTAPWPPHGGRFPGVEINTLSHG